MLYILFSLSEAKFQYSATSLYVMRLLLSYRLESWLSHYKSLIRKTFVNPQSAAVNLSATTAEESGPMSEFKALRVHQEDDKVTESLESIQLSDLSAD